MSPPPYRQRALSGRLHRRSRIIEAVRRFFVDQDYLEVDTPLRMPTLAPEPHIQPQPAGDWFLQTSPELCMKRLLASGYTHIFQICKCFRRHERGQRHLPEFLMLEWYTAGQDYRDLMTQSEALITAAAGAVGLNRISFAGHTVELARPWSRLRVTEAFERYGRMPVAAALARDCFDEIMALDIEPHLGFPQPVFLYEYPAACGALARRCVDRPDTVERFELYLAGLELCNAFGELTDRVEQTQRFQAALKLQQEQGGIVLPWPARFLEALPYVPACAGNAMGLDRLVMLLTDAPAIDDVTAFVPEEL